MKELIFFQFSTGSTVILSVLPVHIAIKQDHTFGLLSADLRNSPCT